MAPAWISSVGSFLTLLAAALFMVAALHDLIARTVPNWMGLALATVGVTARALDGQLISGIACGVAVFAIAAFCWRRGWMGGGDVKLLGAGATAVAPAEVLTFLTVMAIAGAVLAIIYLVGRSSPPPHRFSLPEPNRVPRQERWFPRVLRVELRRFSRGGPLPYACAIAAGGLFVLL